MIFGSMIAGKKMLLYSNQLSKCSTRNLMTALPPISVSYSGAQGGELVKHKRSEMDLRSHTKSERSYFKGKVHNAIDKTNH